MMLPLIDASGGSRDFIDSFGGYHHTDRCRENESFDEKNISSDVFPNLSPREPRVVFKTVTNCKGLHVNDGLVEIKKDTQGDGTALFYEGTKIRSLTGNAKRQMCSMGAYVIIWPDKIRFNTKTGEAEDLTSTWTSSGSVSFQMCKIDGSTISPTVSSTAPSNPSPGQYWIDTSTTPNALKTWSQSQGQWLPVATSYTKISAPNIGRDFEKMDVVKISGVTGTYASTFNTDMCIWDKSNDSIIVTALINQTFTKTGITIKREPPDLDYICEHGNRIWGCSSQNHEIYACKLGDPKNWRSYLGTTEDSYTATVGTDGDFTGCAEQGGTVVFFKETHIHKLYGNYPSNYQIEAKPERGCQKGCASSIKLINGLLIYKAVDGVCIYEGSFPRLLSSNLGRERYKDATAGVWNDKYYIVMTNEATNVRSLFVYDIKANIWHIEDTQIDFDFFINHKNRLMFYDGTRILAEDRNTKIGDTTYSQDGSTLSWMWESGIIGLDSPATKYISQLVIRMSMELGSTLNIELEYDSSGEWEKKGSIENNYEISRRNTQGYTKLRSIELPIIPRRCDHMRIRLSGNGMTTIFSISKRIEQGGLI